MKEKKEVLPTRYSPKWIKFIKEWCEEHGITPSEYIQSAVYEKMLEDGYVE